MPRQPSYPKDAAVGSPPGESGAAGAKAGAGEKAPESKRTKYLATGAAIGIGSAAIVAALLYANRNRRG
ncbi:MAG TPA: hypothetical protein VGD66_15240 [Allosphingosinicella sp.]|jgi:hypothetical protein